MTTYHRFMKFVSESDNCWSWSGWKDSDGYGGFQFCGKSFRANRFSYMLFIGEIPDGMQVCHSCDNPSCVNPGHLWVGSAKDNAVDKTSKGRAIVPLERRLKISSSLKGVKKTEDHARNIGLGHKGKIISIETRLKLSAANLGRKRL